MKNFCEYILRQFGQHTRQLFNLQSIQIIYCNLAIQLIESEYLKMTKAS